jgi:uncharacterized metal-binding protein YceD (DUF177 family)
MKSTSYIIEFAGLKNGIHSFEFNLDKNFLELFPIEDTIDMNIDLAVELEKSDSMLSINCFIKGKTIQPCDSCGELCEIELENEDQLMVKFSSNAEQTEDTDNLMVLGLNEHKVDISQFVYELVVLSTPLKRTHEEGKCNEVNLSLLQSEKIETTDPRWAALKNIEI